MTTAAERPLRVLLVEDDDGHRELACRAFRAIRTWSVDLAESVSDARERIREEPPDLVISDLRLPDGRGIDLVVGDEDVPDYPVVIMTSHGDESCAVEAIKAGAFDYVVKSDRVFADMPRVAERALREWRHIVEKERIQEELRQRERELKHAQKMEALGRLAGGVAHDFNNVLMGILSCADVALSRLQPDSEARPFVEEAKRAALGGSSIARGLLTFSRMEDSELLPIEVDVALEATREMLRLLVGTDVVLNFDLASEHAWVRAGRGEIEQAILNLAINARDAMPEGGTLTISTEVVSGDPQVQIRIADTGVGMDEATLARALEPFFTTKEHGKGTGLGLSSVYGMVERWGGTLTLESEPRAGTTVRIRLPLVEAPEIPSPVPQRTASANILVVDDDARVRLGVQHYLENAGHRVHCAEDGSAALSILKRTELAVDLLLTDVALPDLGGPELAREACSLRPNLPVVFMSGHAPTSLLGSASVPAGATLLRKPFDQAVLLARVSSALAPTISASRRVLFVEDHEPSRMAFRELLSDCGFDVVDVGSVAHALAEWEKRPTFDAVVTDIHLPDASGFHLVRELRKQKPELCAVFVSGRSRDESDVREALKEPSTAFLSKPVDCDELALRLRELLGREQAEE
jgi:DNA-binding NtrC family response regulator/anti-sigma regulatory factor (Ser/Thr protein kinase)